MTLAETDERVSSLRARLVSGEAQIVP